MSISLIATDMDGTLLSDDHVTIPKQNLDALRGASARGIQVAIASGRPWCFVRELVEHMECVDFAVTCNGASVLDVKADRWLVEGGLEEPIWQAIFAVLLEYDLPFMAYCQGRCYMEERMVSAVRSRPILSPEFQAVAERETVVVPNLAEALAGRRVEKVDTFFIPPGVRQEMTARLRAIGPLYLASGLADNMEISSASTDKGRALEALCAQRGIGAEQVMAFGDAGNDVEMLRWAGWSFAMDNASQAAKEAAQYRAPSNQKAGVGQMIARYA